MRLIIELIGFAHGKSYGYEEYIFNLLRDFKRNRSQIKASEIIIVCHEDQKEYFSPILCDGTSVFTVKYSNIIERQWQSEVIPKKLELTEKDLIFYPGDFMPLRRNMTKTLMVVHDLLFMYNQLCENTLYFKLFRLKQYLYELQGIRKANKVIAISNFTRNDILKKISHVSSSKIETIYNYFCFDKYDYNEERKIGDLAYPYILSVCAGNKHKNHRVLLESFSMLASQDDNIHFVLVGSIHADALSYYENLPINVKNRFHLMKHISNADLAYLYTNAKLYVSASLFEGLGMPVVEALYFGLPVILSDIEVHREISFNKAIYFKSDSAVDLYQKEKEVIEGKSEYPIIDKKMIIERYSASNTSMKYIDVINKLLGGGNFLVVKQLKNCSHDFNLYFDSNIGSEERRVA